MRVALYIGVALLLGLTTACSQSRQAEQKPTPTPSASEDPDPDEDDDGSLTDDGSRSAGRPGGPTGATTSTLTSTNTSTNTGTGTGTNTNVNATPVPTPRPLTQQQVAQLIAGWDRKSDIPPTGLVFRNKERGFLNGQQQPTAPGGGGGANQGSNQTGGGNANAVTYTNRVKAIVDTNCATAGCHTANSQARQSLADYNAVRTLFNAALNRATRQAGSNGVMPPRGGRLSAAEIQALRDWQAGGFTN